MNGFKILIFFTLFCSCCGQKTTKKKVYSSDSFLDAVLNDTRVSSSYLSISLNPNSEFLVIQNNDFYNLMRKRKEITMKEYRDAVKLLFITKVPFKLRDYERMSLESEIILSSEINKMSSSMLDSIEDMFIISPKNSVQKREINDDFMKLIIHDRFTKKYLIYFDDISGRLIFKKWKSE